MTERTAEQTLINAAFPITFGDETFKVKRLSINRAKEWREKVIAHDISLADRFAQEDLVMRISALSQEGQGLVVDLVVAFIDAQKGDKVTREQIEEANDDQLIYAYEEFLRVTFPNALDAGTKALRQVLSSPSRT